MHKHSRDASREPPLQIISCNRRHAAMFHSLHIVSSVHHPIWKRNLFQRLPIYSKWKPVSQVQNSCMETCNYPWKCKEFCLKYYILWYSWYSLWGLKQLAYMKTFYQKNEQNASINEGLISASNITLRIKCTNNNTT